VNRIYGNPRRIALGPRFPILTVFMLLTLFLCWIAPAAYASGYPNSDEGAIVGDGDGASFQLHGGQRHWIPDTGTYWTIYFMNGERAWSNWSKSQVYGIPEGSWATAPAYPPADEGAIIHLDGTTAAYQLSNGTKHWIPDTSTYWSIYNANGNRDYAWGSDRFSRVPTGAPVCQCVTFVANYFSLSGATGDAKDMGSYLSTHGFHQVSAPTPGAVIIFQPSFGSGINQSAGHIGLIASVVSQGSQWSLTVRGANQGGNLFTQDNCGNVSLVVFRSYPKPSNSVSYWVR